MENYPTPLFEKKEELIEFKFLNLEQLQEVNTFQWQIKNAMENKELYSPNSIGALERILSGNGFIIGIYDKKELVGICGISYPESNSPFNLGYKINLDEEDRNRVCMIDNIALLPRYRGKSIIQNAIQTGLKKAKSESKTICLATVSLDNFASKNNMLKAGLEVIATLEGMYPDQNFPKGKTRFLLKRDL